MQKKLLALIGLLCATSVVLAQMNRAAHRIVLLTTAKTHGPGEHEHTKNARLIKAMLEHCNVKGISVSIYNTWPEDERVLDSANLVMTLSGGRDGIEEVCHRFLL